MGIVVGWVAFAVIVGIAANSRGRSGVGYFILSLLLSPLIGILFVLALPNLAQQDLLRQLAAQAAVPHKKSLGGRYDRVTVDRSPKPFEPDGILAGIPYRVAQDGSIHAVMQGVTVRFQDFDKFTGALGVSQ